MEVKLQIPDQVAQLLSQKGDLSRLALEALALEGYREDRLTISQLSEMLGFSRIQAEDFLGSHGIPLMKITEADLDREAAIFETAGRKRRD